LLDDPDQDLAVDVAGLVRGAADGSVGVESDFIIFSVDFGLSFFLVDLKDLFEVDDSLVVGI
jgi:hypothetical protein